MIDTEYDFIYGLSRRFFFQRRERRNTKTRSKTLSKSQTNGNEENARPNTFLQRMLRKAAFYFVPVDDEYICRSHTLVRGFMDSALQVRGLMLCRQSDPLLNMTEFMNSASSATSHLLHVPTTSRGATRVSFGKAEFCFGDVGNPSVESYLFSDVPHGCLLDLFHEVENKNPMELEGFGPIFVAFADDVEYSDLWKRYPPNSGANHLPVCWPPDVLLIEDHRWAWEAVDVSLQGEAVPIIGDVSSAMTNEVTDEANHSERADISRSILEEFFLREEIDQNSSASASADVSGSAGDDVVSELELDFPETNQETGELEKPKKVVRR
jgi:hypothetical protein